MNGANQRMDGITTYPFNIFAGDDIITKASVVELG